MPETATPTALDRQRIDRLMRDAGRAINANNGRCGLVEDVLCRVTGLCVDLLAGPADAADPLTWQWLLALPGARHHDGIGPDDDHIEFAVGRPDDCDHGIGTVLRLTIPDADGWADAALVACRDGVDVASVRLAGRLYQRRGDVRDLFRGLGLRTDLDR